jgi:hypothetical protein
MTVARHALPMDLTGIWPTWTDTRAYRPGDIAWVTGPDGAIDYFCSDIAQTGGTAPSRTNLATWTLIDGVNMATNPALFYRVLDDLRDVNAPTNTPAGKVLGTTATGVWGPVDPPASVDSWGRWVGTRAEYDALPTKSPDVLYVITP